MRAAVQCSAVFSVGVCLQESIRRRLAFLPCAIASDRRLGGAHDGTRTSKSNVDGLEAFAMILVMTCDGMDCV